MGKTIFVIFTSLLIIQHCLSAQENVTEIKNGKIGITFSSFGENDVFRFAALDGDAGYSGAHFYTLGIIYVYPLSKWLEAETGIEYSRHSIVIQPNLPPGMDDSSRKENFAFVSIPVTLRANFLKYFFINGGLMVDIDGSSKGSIENQTGIGVLLGLSTKYDFDFGISAFVNPYTKIHSLIPFQGEQYHQRIWENGIRIGLTYDLRKMK